MRSRILTLLVDIQATTKPKMTGEGGLFFIQDPTSIPPIPRPLICISIALQGLSLVGDMVWYVTESAPISFDLSFSLFSVPNVDKIHHTYELRFARLAAMQFGSHFFLTSMLVFLVFSINT